MTLKKSALIVVVGPPLISEYKSLYAERIIQGELRLVIGKPLDERMHLVTMPVFVNLVSIQQQTSKSYSKF